MTAAPSNPAAGTGGPIRLGPTGVFAAYFESGWLFFIPYLGAYLLYAWQKWPVNRIDLAADGSGSSQIVPPLLHIYWVFHFFHLALAAVAIAGGWRHLRIDHLQGRLRRDTLFDPMRLLPWLGLALLFWVPGVYLEYPADTWEHYSRINEWSWVDITSQHSAWIKSGYFFAYSLIGQIAPPRLQLAWFNIYSTICCLLLCWQYFRFARATGLGERASLIFIFLQVLLFGNNLFGFYRYYGVSTTLFAQLGAVALVRIVLGAFSCSRFQNERITKKSPSTLSLIRRPFTFASPSLLVRPLWLPISVVLLLALIAFNHRQGLGIAAAGIVSVIIWRLIVWRRWMVPALAGGALVLSAIAVIWWPRHALLDAAYRPAGWLTLWYGFNLFSPTSPAFERAAAILGLGGLLNLGAGIILLRRNHVIGWITVMPVVLLYLPAVAIPLANALAADPGLEGGYIIAFHRVFLAIPPGLALVALGVNAGRGLRATATPSLSAGPTGAVPTFQSLRSNLVILAHQVSSPFAILLIGLFAFTVTPVVGNYYNRLFNVLMIPPRDLAMRHVIESSVVETLSNQGRVPDPKLSPEQLYLQRGGLLTTPGIAYVLNSTGKSQIALARKRMTWPTVTPASANVEHSRENLRYVNRQQIKAEPFWPLAFLNTTLSQTGYLSGHWLSNEVALEHAAQTELFAAPAESDLAEPARAPQIWLEWVDPRSQTMVPAKGAGLAGTFLTLDDRGLLGDDVNHPPIVAGDELVLHSFMRTTDGDGWRLTLTVRGPDASFNGQYQGLPSPLGGVNWITGESRIKLHQAGEYTAKIIGTTLWPLRTHAVLYHFNVQSR